MNTRYELMVEINGANVMLDSDFNTDGQASISLTYQISDIQDISSKNSSYSKTITLPNNKINREAFEYIFDLNSNSDFDPTKKSKCYVLRDTVLQFEGNLQLTGVTYDRNAYVDSYQCVIYGDNDALYVNIGEKLLSDLDLSVYNHIYGATAIVNSWTSDYTNGYVYPLIDYNGTLTYDDVFNSLNVLDFKPAMYLKPVIDQIFYEAGYSYDSDFFNTDYFKRMIMPFNNAELVPGLAPELSLTFSGPFSHLEDSILRISLTNDVTAGLTASMGTDITSWNSFACDFSYDPNGLYDTSGHLYKAPALAEPFAMRFNLQLVFRIGGLAGGATWSGPGDDITIFVKRNMDNSGVLITGWSDTPGLLNLTGGGIPGFKWPALTFFGGAADNVPLRSRALITGATGGDHLVSYNISTDWLTGAPGTDMQPLRIGEEVRFFFMRNVANPSAFTDIKTATNVYAQIDTSMMVVNAGLSASSLLPYNVKQKDLLTSIFRMFNIYLEPSKEYPTIFRCEPRDDYYKKYQIIKDWSQKLDLSRPIISQVASNTQKRINTFTYKADKDYYNSLYTTQTGQIFGQYEWDIDNDYIADENKLEVVFSPTPIDLLFGSEGMYLATIVNYNNGNFSKYNGMNPRLMFYNKQATVGNDLFIFNETLFSFYPFASFNDDPNIPGGSLNFGQVSAFYSNWTESINTVFYIFWQNTMLEISNKNARIVTAYFNLNATDISQFYFSDIIFFRIDSSENYYKVNRIIDYDPSTPNSTQVELLKITN